MELSIAAKALTQRSTGFHELYPGDRVHRDYLMMEKPDRGTVMTCVDAVVTAGLEGLWRRSSYFYSVD
jgi:hypothetical protein